MGPSSTNQSDNEQPEIVAEDDESTNRVHIDYSPFYEALKKGDRNSIESFIESHPQALITITVPIYTRNKETALHYMVRKLRDLSEGEEIAALLIDRMTPEDLEIKNAYGQTPLETAVAVAPEPVQSGSCPADFLKLMKLMVDKNPKLANIGKEVLVFLAAKAKLKDMAHYLYGFTDKITLRSMAPNKMSTFLKNLVHMDLIGIASDIMQDLQHNRLQDCPNLTITAMVRKCHEDAGLRIDYGPFYKAIKEGDRTRIEDFIKSKPQALITGVPYDDDGNHDNEGTALHYVLRKLDKLEGGKEILSLLVESMRPDHLEMVDSFCNTPLVTAITTASCPVDVVQLMVNKNPNLANNRHKVLVYLASTHELKATTEYLYGVMSTSDKNILLSMNTDQMNTFLKKLVHMNLFGIASDIVQNLSNDLQDCKYQTLPALASKFSSKGFSDIRKDVLNFLRLALCEQSSGCDKWFSSEICGIIVEDAEIGSMEFVTELFKIRPDILDNGRCRARIFAHAIEKREKNIFNLIRTHIEPEDLQETFGNETKDNILHSATKLAPSYVLNRIPGAVLQMQSEIQWFKAVCGLASPEGEEARNSDRFKPHELLIERHKSLKEAGEKSMKEIAQSCTVVGALIVTIMFAAAFTLPGGNDQSTALPNFLKTVMFKVFVICDAISLYSSTASVLACLGILTSRYAEEDFLVKLPTKLLIALSTLFFSITTMMVAFCAALTIILDGDLQFILPVVLLALVPVIIFLWSTVSLLYDICIHTYRPDHIVDKSVIKLPQRTKHEKAMIKPSSTDTKLSNKKEGESMV